MPNPTTPCRSTEWEVRPHGAGQRACSTGPGRLGRAHGCFGREISGGIPAISQFTLYGDTSKGRRPSFIGAAPPERAEPIYEAFCDALSVPVARGVFGAHMVIEAAADGPVTLVLRREADASR